MSEDTHNLNPAAAPILAYLEEETERRCQQLLDDTEREIDRIQRETAAEKARLLEVGCAEFDDIAHDIRTATVGRSQWQARATIQKRIGAAVDEILTACRLQLDALATQETFGRTLESLILEAAAHQPEDRTAKAIVNPRDMTAAKAAINKYGLRLTAEAGDVSGGVVIKIAGSNFRVINTLASRMERQEPKLRQLLGARILEALQAK